MRTDVELYDPPPNTADEAALVAALVMALKAAPGVVVAVSHDVQSEPLDKAA